MIKTTGTGGSPSSSSPPSSSLSRPSAMRRRRQSKGLIADNGSRGSPPSTIASANTNSSHDDNINAPPSSSSSAASASISGAIYAPLLTSVINSAIQGGVITKYHLTSAKARKTLLLRAKAARHRSKVTNAVESEFLASPPAFLEEEYSSGDDDDYEDVALGNPSLTAGGYNPSGNNNNNSGRGGVVEPYFIPTLPESASQSGSAGKLPFNYRKLRYFDGVTAGDRGVARNWLRGKVAKAKQLRVRKLLHPDTNTASERGEEEESLLEAMQHFPHELTPEMNAALLLEGLALNPLESLEGLSKCYDGIVSAGLALLENNNNNNSNNESTTPGGGKSKKLSKDEIISALEPLLITTLDPTSGEAIRQLSLLKKYCGTKRYQRRFVQRIAPYLVRPPSSAVWCLRHQNDIEPIIAATEMILDASDDLFSVGWVERGKALEMDSQRAEKLRLAVGQLRKSNSPTEGLLSGLGQLASSTRRGSSTFGSAGRRDHIVHDQLAEWELVSIDRQIRQSVSDLFTKDWSRIAALNLSPVESDTMSYGVRRRSLGKKAEWSEGVGSSVGAATNSTMTKRSKIPLSPRATTVGGQIGQVIPSADALESTFGPSFSSQDIDADDNRPLSPPNYSSAAAPLSPTREAGRLTTPKTPPHDRDIEHPSSPGAYRSGLAPLSPGNASSTSDGALSSRSVSGPAGSRDQYRALTSTAAERKRTVAACRALRAQITKFEESFFQMHGRPPKGTAERAPLASTYTQYREWKRAIRADAACRIQALFRGSLIRSKMARSVDPRVSRIVAARRLRIQRIDRKSEHLSHLSIPLDIGSDHHDSFDASRGADAKSRLEVRTTSRDNDDGVEMVMKTNATTSPGWSSRKHMSNQPAHHSPGSQNSNSSRPKTNSSLPDVTEMSLPELQQRKRELKQQLKMYDLNFHAQHGRMPEKREKEPIRHLYESYNAYKNQITVIEKGEAQPGPGTAAFRGRDTVVSSPKAPPIKEIIHDRLSPSTQSPISNSQSPEGTPSPKNDFINHTNEVPKNGGSDDAIPQDLTALKAEKATLHQMLRSYEKDFFKQHKRQVSSFSDIKPVAGQYRRYKEIKKAIAQLSDK